MVVIENICTVGLVIERRVTSGDWGRVVWRPSTIFPAAPDVAVWTPLGGTRDVQQFFAGAYDIHLYSTDTANYRDNLESGEPKLWVVLRPEGAEPPVDVLLITADPAEGEGNTEAGANIVEALTMPAEVAGVVAEFIAAHHVERPIIKRRRDRAEPDIRWRDPGDRPPETGPPDAAKKETS